MNPTIPGIHHVTAITADAQRNVDFYAGVLGLRLVKKSVNQDDTSVYHLFYADETGDPGSDITFFEYPGVAQLSRGFRSGVSFGSIWSRRCSNCGVSDSFAPSCSSGSSTVKPGPIVAISNSTPDGSRK